MRNSHRADGARKFGHGAERNQSAGGRADVELRQRVGIRLILRLHFHDDPVFVDVGVNSGNLALAVSVEKRFLNLLRRHAQRGGLVAVYFHGHLWIGDQQIARHILKPVQPGHAVHQNRRPAVKLARIAALKRKLIKRLGERAAHANQRRVLQIDFQAGNPGELGAQRLDDFVGALSAFGARFQAHEQASAIAGDRRSARANGRHESRHIRVLAHDSGCLQLMFAHGVEGNVLRRLGGAENLAGVFVRKKPGGNHDE